MANKIFFPPGGVKTFSDNLVGFQIVDGGGLTQGNFEFTSAIYEKTNRKFDTGIFSNPYTLENLKIDNIEEVKRIIEKTFKVYPNFDISEITSFSLYGSLQKRMSTSIIKVINFFPAALEVYPRQTSGLYTGNTAYNVVYDRKNDETTFDINTGLIYNPFSIDYSENAARNILTRPITVSPFRDMTNNFESYAVYFRDISTEYKVTDMIPVENMTGGTLTLTVKGDMFSGQSASTFNLVIKLNNETTEKVFLDDFDEVEDFMLNRSVYPKYSAKFTYPDYDSAGKYTLFTKQVTWPLDRYWNLDINSTKFEQYISQVQGIAEKLDEYKTNLISRFLITGSFKEFDTDDQKIEKVLQIYGRSFDEVKKFIDALAYMNSVNYQVGNDIPSQLLTNLAQTLGINSDISPITNEGFLNSVFDPNAKQVFPGQSVSDTPTELNYQYYRNIILNSAHMFRTKGTRQSLEYVMRFIGAPEALLEFNEVIYLADTKINYNDFYEKYCQISGGTTYVETPVFDPTNTFSLMGVTYTGYTTSGVINLITTTLDDYGVDSDGYPQSPATTDDNFYQKGAGWFETSPEHRSNEEADSVNSSFNPANPYLVSSLKPFTYGQEYMDRFRDFPDIAEGYTLTKISDNQKSWAVNDTGNRKDGSNFNGVDYTVSDDRLVINSKNIELYTNMGQGITYDIWDMSVKYGYPIPNSGLTAPYPYPGNIDWTFINPKPKEKTFFEFAQSFYNNFINVRNRQTIFDGKTGGYPTLQSVYWRYLESDQTVGIPSNKFTYQKMIDYTLGLGDHWQRLLEQVVPGTTLWLTGQKMENSIFHRQKFVWRRQRGCTFIPVSCIPCTYNGEPFSYDCIDQTLQCNVTTDPAAILNYALNNVLTNSGFTQSDCDINSIVTNWYIDCRLDSQILVQEQFYTGYGIGGYPSTTDLVNAINTYLVGLYNYGLNFYLAGSTLIVSNSTCYDNFTNSTLYLNIGVDLQINCNQSSTTAPPIPTPTPTPTPTVTPTPTPICVSCDIGFDFYDINPIAKISVGLITASCDPSVTDYVIDWYGPGSGSTSISFTSGYGSDYVGDYLYTHPLTGSSAVPITAGIYTPTLRKIKISGTEYTDLNCFSATTVNVDPLTCYNGGGTTDPDYSHQITFTADVSVTPQPVTTTFSLDPLNPYFAYSFKGEQIYDNLKITFFGSNYTEPIVLEYVSVGANQTETNFNLLLNPKKVKTSNNNISFPKVLCLTGLTVNLGDYLEIEVTPNTSTNNTSWEFFCECLDSFNCDLCIDDTVPPIKLIESSITKIPQGCDRYAYQYQISGCQTSDIYKYLNPTKYFNGFIDGTDYNNSINRSYGTSPLGTAVILSFNPIFTCGIVSYDLYTPNCDTPNTNTITYNKSVVLGEGLITITFDTYSDLEDYKSDWDNIYTSYSGNPTNPLDVDFYRAFNLKIPLATGSTQCGDITGYQDYKIHPSAIVTTGGTGPWTMSITMPTISNSLTWTSCDLNCTNNTNQIVDLLNNSSTGVTNNISFTSNTGSKLIHPFNRASVLNSQTVTLTAQTNTSGVAIPKYVNETISYSGSPLTLVPSLSAQTCDLSSFYPTIYDLSKNLKSYSWNMEYYQIRIVSLSGDFEIWTYDTATYPHQSLTTLFKIYENIGGVPNVIDPTYFI